MADGAAGALFLGGQADGDVGARHTCAFPAVVCVCMCVCVCARVRACVHACMRVCIFVPAQKVVYLTHRGTVCVCSTATVLVRKSSRVGLQQQHKIKSGCIKNTESEKSARSNSTEVPTRAHLALSRNVKSCASITTMA